eukprot:TRINITY_DN4780_c0_g2_i5.p1 TRINITY_DN4780_c0_g2~~TRINITY_DN4780_c0_g2_i5.p1  ORF type:complete len:330 (-),score=64.48 TRINITY_DN4780_c0_g2_i5:916-1905(-)
MEEVSPSLTESPSFVVSNWGRSALRKLPRYWPYVTYLSLSSDGAVVELHLSPDAIKVSLLIDPVTTKCIKCTVQDNNNQMMNNCNAEDRQLVDEKKDQDEDDEAGQLESTIAIRIDQIAEICNLYVQSHQGVSLVLFVDGICNEIFKLYSELRTRPLTFLTTSPTRRSSASGRRFDWSWNAGCDLLLFILGSSTYFGGVKSSLKPFPEFDRIEDCPWVGSPSDIHEVVQAVSRLQSCQIRESRDLLKLDRTTQWLPLWVEKYQNVVLKLKLLDRPDPRVNAGAWKAPDYQFDAELLPDPHFDALCQKIRRLLRIMAPQLEIGTQLFATV